MIAYRTGDSETALRCLREAQKNQAIDIPPAYVFAVLCLVHTRLGQLDEARETCDQAAQRVERLLKNSFYRNNHDTFLAQLLLREAQSQLRSEAGAGATPDYFGKSGPEIVPALIRQCLLKPRLREIAEAVDSSPWRKSLRAALDARDSSALLLLTTGEQFQDQPADLVAWLGSTLREGNEIDTSVALLQAAQQQHPGDFWLNYELGKSLDAKGEKLEALGYARAALAIRPDSQGTQMAVSNALRNSGQVEASNRMFKKILNNSKMTSRDFSSLGLALRSDLDRSIFCYQKAIELDPKNVNAHNHLGNALSAKGQVDEAIAEVFKYSLTGTLLGSWTIDAANSSPTGLTIDPNNVSNIWTVDSGTKKVYQYNAATSLTSGSQSAAATFALAAGNSNPQDIADPPFGLESITMAVPVVNNDSLTAADTMANRVLQAPLVMVVSSGVVPFPMPSLGTASSDIAMISLHRIQTTARITDDFMSTLGRSSQMPQAPVSLARTISIVTGKSIHLSQSDEFEIEDDLSDLIGLIAKSGSRTISA